VIRISAPSSKATTGSEVPGCVSVLCGGVVAVRYATATIHETATAAIRVRHDLHRRLTRSLWYGSEASSGLLAR